MSKESWFSVIPFINQYPPWAQIILVACVVVFICISIFAYPKHLQEPMAKSVQEVKIDKSTKIDTVEGDYVNGDKNIYTTPETKEESMPKLSSLSFLQITEAIKRAPPLQRDDIKNHYKGITVVWDGYLKSAKKGKNNTVSLLLATDLRGSIGIISCEVPLNEYRELSIFPDDTKIRIQGEIAGVDNIGADLINVKLFFPDMKASRDNH